MTHASHVEKVPSRPQDTSTERLDRTGFLEALGCQVMWGFMCLYWRLLSGESALLVLTCRMVWSCVFIVLLCSFVKRTKFLHLMRDPRALLTFITSGVLTSANWGVYIWAANSGHLLETSIGYYLCPLFNILFGLIVFHERLTRMQKVAFGLAACGVTFFIAVNGGAIWISFALALTFSAYGAVKKRAGYPALPGMALESVLTGIMGGIIFGAGTLMPALWALVPATPDAMAVTYEPLKIFLMVFAGVLTAIPLLLYSAAANRVPMVIIGFLQYVSPTIALVLAVTFFGEAFTFAHGVCFALVWTGIILMSIESLLHRRYASSLDAA